MFYPYFSKKKSKGTKFAAKSGRSGIRIALLESGSFDSNWYIGRQSQ